MIIQLEQIMICISAKTPSVWFSSHEEMWIFVMFDISAFHPSFVHKSIHVHLYINLSNGVRNSGIIV